MFERIDSTNNFIEKMMAEKELESGTVIYAKDQTAGRGEGNNSWECEPDKNLTFTALVYPEHFNAEDQFKISQITAIAARNCISKLTLKEVKVKWPNDIYIGDKKIGGILIKNRVMGSEILNTIVGVGINVNQTNFKWAPNPTSIATITKKEHNIREVLDLFCLEFNKLFILSREEINNQYLDSLYRKGEPFYFQDSNGKFRGEIIDVNSYGMLNIKTSEGVKTYGFKEVQYII